MTVKAYIPRDALGRERNFWTPHERRTAPKLVRALWNQHNSSRILYAVVVNVQDPPADAIIVTEDGIGVIELKDYGGRIQGTEDSIWVAKPSPRDQLLVEAGRSYLNPFRQVRVYQDRLRDRLVSAVHKRGSPLPTWLSGPLVRLQATVCFTQEANFGDLRIAPRWFEATTLGTISEWAYALAFGEGRLTSAQVEHIASNILGGKESAEIMPTGAPHGYLWVIEGTRAILRLALDRDDMCIGRALDCGTLILSDRYRRVSRHHARLRSDEKGVSIYDGSLDGRPSTRGTFVNGTRIGPDGLVLHEGDVIVLGGYEDEGHVRPATGACMLRFHHFRAKSPRVTETDPGSIHGPLQGQAK